MTYQRLKHIASVAVSNVDKKASDGEVTVRLCNYTDVYYNDRITAELPMMEATATYDQIARFGLRSGDVLITKDSETPDDIAVPSYVVENLRDVVCGYHLALLRPEPETDGRFLFWALASRWSREQFAAAANGITRFGLKYDTFGEVRVPFPPLSQQRAIADYLDRETVRIDALIERKQRMTALVEERLLTCLDQLALPGDSLVPLRRYATVQGGVTVDAGRATDRTVRRPYLRVANVQDGFLDLSEMAEIEVSIEVAARSTLQPGDVLMTEANGNSLNLGRGAVWMGEVSECLHQNHVFAIRTNQRKLRPAFLSLMTQSSRGRSYFQLVSSQVGIATISKQNVLDFPVPYIAVNEQDRRVSVAMRQSEQIQAARKTLQRQSALLREHRQALITAAVTGELDIPGVAA